MEFLIISRQFAQDLIVGNYITAAVLVLPFLLPNALVEKTAKTFGKFASTFLRQKTGKGTGEKVERWFQGTLNAAIRGLNEGLDADDKS